MAKFALSKAKDWKTTFMTVVGVALAIVGAVWPTKFDFEAQEVIRSAFSNILLGVGSLIAVFTVILGSDTVEGAKAFSAEKYSQVTATIMTILGVGLVIASAIWPTKFDPDTQEVIKTALTTILAGIGGLIAFFAGVFGTGPEEG